MLGKFVGKKISQSIADKKFLILGGVLAIGSVGLLMGALTCAVSSLFFVYGGYSLVVSMVWGFFITGIAFLLTGVGLILWGAKK